MKREYLINMAELILSDIWIFVAYLNINEVYSLFIAI